MAAGEGMTTIWPVSVKLGELHRGAVHRQLVADELALVRIAKGLDLVSLGALEAAITVKPWMDGASLSVRWRATVTQTCVVTLDPLTQDLQGNFTVRLLPRGSPALPEEGSEIDLDPDSEDPPDILESDQIDTGAYVIEHLALEIDPFPRTPGVEFQAPPAEEPPSPFAVLRRLKDPDPEG